MKSRVALVKVHPQGTESTVLKAVRESIDLIGGVANFCSKGHKVLVKPNIASPNGFESTNPAVTYAVAKIFSRYGCEVLIGEDPSIPTKEDFAYTEYGLYELAEEANAKVVSLRYGPHTMIKVPGGGYFSEIEVSKIAVEADLVVSVAAMKSANITTVTLGLKNMKGVIRPAWKRKFHTEGLNQGIVDLNIAVKPGLVIIDGTFGTDMSEKVCHPVGLIIASSDFVAGDAVCSKIMGFNPEDIEHIRLAKEAGIGEYDLDNIEIRGEKIENWTGRFPFSPPKDPFKLAEESEGKIKIIQGNPCSVCLNELGQTLALCKDHLKDLDNLAILVGPNVDPSVVSDKRRVILFGKCLKTYSDKGIYVDGCPPTEYEAAKTGSLKKVLDEILKVGNPNEQ